MHEEKQYVHTGDVVKVLAKKPDMEAREMGPCEIATKKCTKSKKQKRVAVLTGDCWSIWKKCSAGGNDNLDKKDAVKAYLDKKLMSRSAL